MSYETTRLPPPPPVSQWPGLPALRPDAGQATGFDPALLAADPAEVEFALDPASVRITGENAQQWNTTYSASGEMQVSAPGVEAQTVPVRYDVTIRNGRVVQYDYGVSLNTDTARNTQEAVDVILGGLRWLLSTLSPAAAQAGPQDRTDLSVGGRGA